MILLDTCGLLALQDGGRDLSPEARSRLEAPGSHVFISAISAFALIAALSREPATSLDLQRATNEAHAFFSYLKRFAAKEQPGPRQP